MIAKLMAMYTNWRTRRRIAQKGQQLRQKIEQACRLRTSGAVVELASGQTQEDRDIYRALHMLSSGIRVRIMQAVKFHDRELYDRLQAALTREQIDSSVCGHILPDTKERVPAIDAIIEEQRERERQHSGDHRGQPQITSMPVPDKVQAAVDRVQAAIDREQARQQDDLSEADEPVTAADVCQAEASQQHGSSYCPPGDNVQPQRRDTH